MKGGTLSRHKKTKFGMLPGEVPKGEKIAMLEGDISELDRRTAYLHETGFDSRNEARAKSYKKDFVRMANRRARRAPISTEE